jgi:aquaporin Z
VNYLMLRAPVAEFIGTFLFVLVGAGSSIANQGGGAMLAIALTHGIALAVIVTIMLPISGGHINPAVSFALWIGKQIDAVTLGKYVLAQLLGAVLAALVLKATFPAAPARMTSLGTPQISGAMLSIFPPITLEALFTFFLVSAVYGTCVSSQAQRVGGFAIGLVVLVCALGGGALTGAAMNPARAFGPALVSWDWHAQAIYWIGPLLGAAVAAVVWRFLLLPPSATDLR